jgi:hypothetical protein
MRDECAFSRPCDAHHSNDDVIWPLDGVPSALVKVYEDIKVTRAIDVRDGSVCRPRICPDKTHTGFLRHTWLIRGLANDGNEIHPQFFATQESITSSGRALSE